MMNDILVTNCTNLEWGNSISESHLWCWQDESSQPRPPAAGRC